MMGYLSNNLTGGSGYMGGRLAQNLRRQGPNEDNGFKEFVKNLNERMGIDNLSPENQKVYDIQGLYNDPQRDKLMGVDKYDGRLHLSDKYKKPAHPTFSTESSYYKDMDSTPAGTWGQNGDFIPPAFDNGPLDNAWAFGNKNIPAVTDMRGGTIAINPYHGLSPDELMSVIVNENARLQMQRDAMVPDFLLTPEQVSNSSRWNTSEGISYQDDPVALKQTMAARMLSGDPSAGTPTAEQSGFVGELARRLMGNSGGWK